MHPVLLQLHLPLVGSFTVSSFGAMMAGAFLAGHEVIRRELRRLGRDEALAGQIVIGAALGGIAGAKLYYLLLNWPETLADPLGMVFARAGLVWYGGFFGGAIGVLYAIRRRREPLETIADACAPALALAYGLGRIGCFLVGDDYGLPTTSWIGVAFRRAHHRPRPGISGTSSTWRCPQRSRTRPCCASIRRSCSRPAWRS